MRRLTKTALMVLRSGHLRQTRHRLFMHAPPLVPFDNSPGNRQIRVLIIGIYLGDKENTVEHLCNLYRSSGKLIVEQRWAALGTVSQNPGVRALTKFSVDRQESKYALLNRLLRSADFFKFDYVIISDDDIYLRPNSLQALIAYQERFDLACAQPARAWHSHFDLSFPLRRPWLQARQTRFVESGPLVSMRMDAARILLPFEDGTPLWGVDLVWPARLEENKLRMGIVDAVPVDHSLRPQGKEYRRAQEQASMEKFLEGRPHLPMNDAFTTIKSYRR